MKKLTKLLTLAIASGGLVLGLAGKQAKESKADDYESYIKVDAGLFTNWTDDAGSFGDQNSTFWGENYSFQAVDTFYRGESKESWTGTLTTRSWKQKEQYIYFQFGGARNFDVTGDPVHLNIHYGNYQYSFYNDTFRENRMLMRYFKIPDAAYNDLLSKGSDFDMYIEIVDYQVEGYGFANFGYLNVNQTEEQVSNALRWYVNHLNRDNRAEEVEMRKLIVDNYLLNDGLKALFLKPVDDISDSFDSNADFVNHWYFDYHYAREMNWDFHVDRAIGHDSYRPDAPTNMPFNNENGFFRGWFENDELGGFVGGDASFYRFVSRPFVLSGTGLVSIKMAGTASLHVIDAETRQDLVWANLLSYSSEGDQVNLATSGFNTVTMVRHIINLEAYLGRKIQLAIADVSSDGWSALYVDELVTNYETYPAFKVDTFTQVNESGIFNAYRTDKYINSSLFNDESNPTGLRMVLESSINQENDNAILNHEDNSPAKEAYEFLESYYSSLRAPGNKFDYFEASDEVRNDVVAAYTSLGEEAKAIVDKSTDIIYNGTFSNEWWNNKVDTSSTVGKEIAVLMAAEVYSISFVANGGSGEMASVSREDGSVYALPECGFTAPEGKQFAGWTVNDDVTLRAPGYEITINDDVTLTAQWEEVSSVYTYSVIFNGNGATSGTMDPDTFTSSEYSYDYVLPECRFEREGYEFKGWALTEQGLIKFQPGQTKNIQNGETTFFAIWAEQLTITFDANGGTGSMEALELEEGSKYTLPECGFTAPEGYEFAGWKVGNDVTLKQPGEEITINGDVTIVAQWSLIPIPTYTVTFNGNGGSGSMDPVTKEEGSVYVLPQCKFNAPKGYEFAGWTVGSDDTLRQPGEEITIVGDVEIRAEWKLLPIVYYTVSFDANGGTGSMASQSIESGKQFTLPACSFVAPEGYEFDYWIISSVKYQPGEKITVVGETVIKASWKKVEQEEPKEEEQPEEEEHEEESKSFLDKLVEFFQNFFKKIAEFFENLFKNSAK